MVSKSSSRQGIVLGIDVGTQSTKVILYDAGQRVIAAEASAPHPIEQQDDGTSEQQAEWWLVALERALAATPSELRAAIRAVGVSGQQHGFVPLASDGSVLRPVKLWNDTSTTEECALIEQRLGGRDATIAEVGNPQLPGYTAPKVLWLKRRHPDLYARLQAILLPHDYVNFVLTGVLAMEHGDASGTGLLDVRSKQWSQRALHALDDERDLTPCLPPLLAADEVLGAVTPAASARFGIPEGVLVCTGAGDNMAAAIGLGCVEDGVVCASLGTSGTLFAYSDSPIVDPGGDVAAFCASTGGWLPLVCTMNCTVATELSRELLELPLDAIDELAASAPAGCDGLLTLPFFTGERTPNLPNAKGCLLGLTPTTYRRGHLLRSSMEAALFGLRYGLDLMRSLGVTPRAIHLTGGGAKSPLWQQMAADILGYPVRRPVVEETAAFGAALKALWTLEGSSTELRDLVATHVRLRDEETQPDTSTQAIYDSARSAWQAAIGAVVPLFDQ